MSGTIQASIVKDSASATNNLTLDTGGNATVGNTLVMGSSFLRNRIINGDMRIDQRNAGASVTQTAVNAYTLDRWVCAGSVTSKFTVQQNAGSLSSANRPAGFSNYLGVTSSAATTVSTGDFYYLMQGIEGFNVADLGWGTANAQTVTLSFWVRSSLTGTFAGTIRNLIAGATRSYPFTYTINAANTFEQKTITIAGDTSGTWATDNSNSVTVCFSMGSGATFSGTAGAWAAGNLISATGATSVVGTSGATFYVTGVQFEVGTVATPFERRQYGQELVLCQRYYQQITGNASPSGFSPIGTGFVSSSSLALILIPLATTMRQAPTYSFTGTISVNTGLVTPNLTSISTQYTGTGSTGFIMAGASAGTMTTGGSVVLYTSNATTNSFAMSSEL